MNTSSKKGKEAPGYSNKKLDRDGKQPKQTFIRLPGVPGAKRKK